MAVSRIFAMTTIAFLCQVQNESASGFVPFCVFREEKGMMISMKEMNLLINEFYYAHKKIHYLHSIRLYRDEDDIYSKYCLDITLSDRQIFKQKMLIHFSGVVDFKSTNLDSLCALLITIVDVSANQMEEINYKVKEDEYELFSFWCKDFEYSLM
jgi:hypothetical protein